MAYNKAKEERKWKMWKAAEEQQMRDLGVSEAVIEQLHDHDWAIFNSERRYYEKKYGSDAYLEEAAASEPQSEIETVEDFLESIEDENLYRQLIEVDKLTLQIILWKMEGYSSNEIAEKCGLSENAINFRIWHLRKKIKNIS